MGMNICDSSGKWEKWVDLSATINLIAHQESLVTEKRDKYSFSFGDVEMVQLFFPDVYITYGDMRLKQLRLRFLTDNMPDMVELHFALSGNGILDNAINAYRYTFGANQQNILYAPAFDGTAEFDTSQGYRFFELHFTKTRFLELANDTGGLLQPFADKVAAGQFAELAPENLPISMAMHTCIHDIMHCSYQGGLKLLFLQSKCIELLVLQAQAFAQAQNKAPTSALRSAYDIERVHFAKDYLLAHVAAPPSFPELARIAGINEFKLKNGFREIFNTSVIGYLNDHKLSTARQMLLAGNAIKEVAETLGYSSVQHFGNAFRKKFGTPPGKIKG